MPREACATSLLTHNVRDKLTNLFADARVGTDADVVNTTPQMTYFLGAKRLQNNYR